MSLEFMDGFDHYSGSTTNVQRKWDASSLATTGAGRFGGGALAQTGFGGNRAISRAGMLSAIATRTVGFAFICSGNFQANGNFFQFLDSGNEQVSLRHDSGGLSASAIVVSRAGTTLATSTLTMTSGQWYYIEFQCTIGASGSYAVNVNGVNWITGTGNTQATANPTMNGLSLNLTYTGGNSIFFDDFYCLNPSGTVNNTFLGECRILTSLPTGDSSVNLQWTPSPTGAHFANVSDNPPDDDTSYNYSNVVGRLDTYTFPSLSPTGAIAAVQSTITARRDDISPRSIREEVRGSDGNNYDGAVTFPLQTNYAMYMTVRENDPTVISPWTPTSLNATEFGVKLAA